MNYSWDKGENVSKRPNLTMLRKVKNLDPHQYLMASSLTHTASFHQVLWKSVQLFLFNLRNKPANKWTGVKASLAEVNRRFSKTLSRTVASLLWLFPQDTQRLPAHLLFPQSPQLPLLPSDLFVGHPLQLEPVVTFQVAALMQWNKRHFQDSTAVE